jgi:hypothetical protein
MLFISESSVRVAPNLFFRCGPKGGTRMPLIVAPVSTWHPPRHASTNSKPSMDSSSDSPAKVAPSLFKYFDPSKLAIFEKRLMLLTPPIYMNDLWEFRPKGRTPSEDEIIMAWLEIEAVIALSSVLVVPARFAHHQQQDRLERIRAGLGSMDFLAGQGENYQKEISRVIGLVCFTENPLNRVMWGQYAGSHTGFVAELAAGDEFDYDGFIAREMGTRLIAVKVKYPSTHGQISIAEDCSNILEICCSKHPQWGYEAEWRIIAPLAASIRHKLASDNGQESGVRFCIPFTPKNLLSIIFGERMKSDDKKRLLSLLAQEEFKHVRKETTAIDPKTGDLIRTRLESD